MIFRLYATHERGQDYLLDIAVRSGCNLDGGVITNNGGYSHIHVHVETLEQLMALQRAAGDIIIHRDGVDDYPEIEIYNGWRE